jgi:TP901 family phage tail tape measure protein
MADILNVKFTANADFGQLISEANRAMAVLSKFRNTALTQNVGLQKKDFDVATGEFRKAVTAAGYYNSSIIDVTSSTQKFGTALSGQRLKLKDYYGAWSEYSKGAQGQIRKLAQEQVRMSSSIVKSLGRDMSGSQKAVVITPSGIDAVANASKIASQELSVYHKVLRDGSTSLINWGKNTQWAGRQLSVGLTLPLAIFGKTASEAFRAADMELTRLGKVYGGISGISAESLTKVKKDVSELAKTLSSTYGSSFKETLALSADIAATGKEGADLLGSIAETTRLATLGDVDRQDAMKATLALQAAFSMNTKELANSINFLNAVENQTSTTLDDLVTAIPKAGPVIKGLGGSIEDLALLLTAMREGGINASEGANALKSGLASLINPTKVSRTMLEGFGISIDDIVNGNTGDIVGMITDLKTALDTLDPLQKQKAIEQLFGKYQFARINALIENLGKEGSQTLQVLDLMKASTEDLAAVADRELKQLTESASGRYKRALETFKAAISEVGKPFLNIMGKVLEVGAKVLGIFGKLPAPLKAFATGMLVITALAGPLIMLTGLMANFFGYIIKGVAALKQFRSGASAFTLVTTETIAADQVADSYTQSLYNQKGAALVLRTELEKLALAYGDIARAGAIGAPPAGVPVATAPVQKTTVTPVGGYGSVETVNPSAAANVQAFKDTKAGAIRRVVSDNATALDLQTAGMDATQKRKFLERELLKQEAARQASNSGGGRKIGSSTAGTATAASAGIYSITADVLGQSVPGSDILVKGNMRGGGDVLNLAQSASGHVNPLGKSLTGGKGSVVMDAAINKELGAMQDQQKLITDEGLRTQIIANQTEESLRSAKGKGGLPTVTKIGDQFGKLRQKFSKQEIMLPSTLKGASPTPTNAQFLALRDNPAAGAITPVASQPVYTRPTAVDKSKRRNAEKVARDQKRNARVAAKTGMAPEAAKASKSIRQSALSAGVLSNKMGMAAGSIGLASSMMLSLSGNTNQAAMKAANLATAIGFGLPAIGQLKRGVLGAGASLTNAGGSAAKLGKILKFAGGPWGMALIAGITAAVIAIKFFQKKHAEALAKAKADIDVSSDALEAFGGRALNASNAFKAYVDAALALKNKLINDSQSKNLLGLPTQEEINAVKDQVEKLFKDQILKAGGLKDKKSAVEFAKNLKSTLVSQGVAAAQADTIIASIMEQAGKQEFSIPVLMEIQGIKTKSQAFDQLKAAAQKTFEDVNSQIQNGFTVDEGTSGRFIAQIDNLSAAALGSVKNFEDIATSIDVLPESMKNLSFEQLNATTAGQSLLRKMKEVNEPLYLALKSSDSLAGAIKMAAANALGLVSALEGVAARFDIAGQQAMNMVADEAYAASGIQKAFSSQISGQNAIIAKIRERAKAALGARDAQRKAEEAAIEGIKGEIDVLKEAADARKDLLRTAKEAADFERDIQASKMEQQQALMTGNFSQAAIIGLQIDKKMQDKSIDLAEKAIDTKLEAEVKKREEEIKMHEDRLKMIKDLSDKEAKAIEDKAAKEVAAHQKIIASIQEKAGTTAAKFKTLFTEVAQGNVSKMAELNSLIKGVGENTDAISKAVQASLSSAADSFRKFFKDVVQGILGEKYVVGEDGTIFEKTKGVKGRTVLKKTKSSLSDVFFNTLGKNTSDGITGDLASSVSIPGYPGKATIQQGPNGKYIEYLYGDNPNPYNIPYTDPAQAAKVIDSYKNKTYDESKFHFRAMGGPVKKNYMIKGQYANGGLTQKSAFPYIVGEKGPELMIPNMNGNVVPSDKLFNAVRQMNMSGHDGGNDYTINVSVMNSGASADQIASAIESKMRLMNQRVGVSRNA